MFNPTKLNAEENYFMYLITLDEHEPDELNSWEGSIKRMTQITDKRLEKLETALSKEILKLQDQVEQSVKRDAAQDKDLKKTFNLMFTKSSKTQEKLQKKTTKKFKDAFAVFEKRER